MLIPITLLAGLGFNWITFTADTNRPKLRTNAQIEFKKPMSMLNFCFCSHDPTRILLALLAYSTKCAHQHQLASAFINARRRIVQPMIDQSNRAEKAQYQ
uniref:Secreted protein n=1 Tax=Trichogramma kaykai TaxID=54128 RepID=A0ABD2XG45_9HYME